MAISVGVPNISDSDLSSAKERKKIMDMLYALTEELRHQQEGIDESSLSEELIARIRRGETAGAEAVEAKREAVSRYKALLAELYAKAADIKTDYEHAIQENNDTLTSEYVKTTDFDTEIGAFREEVRSQIQQSAQQVTIEFQGAIEDGSFVTETGLSEALEKYEKHFTFSNDGMTIESVEGATSGSVNVDSDNITFRSGSKQMLGQFGTNGLKTGGAVIGAGDSKVTILDGAVTAPVMRATEGLRVDNEMAMGVFKWIDEGENGLSLVRTYGGQ